ncbi:MAG TPA: hypothetical protein VHV83_01705 [Armatimonadota bacterium]|nr:hypothetical protein [Armatimonadota bacterium]
MKRSKLQGPWGFACTALLLAGCLLMISGCRKPSPPSQVTAWARIDALTALHPSSTMVTDIDHRVLTLLAQRDQLLRTMPVTTPPRTIDLPVPALQSMPGPAESPMLDVDADQFRSQELNALKRVLDRDRDEKYKDAQISLRSEYETKLEQETQALVNDAEQRRRDLFDKYVPDLFKAKLSLSAISRVADGPSGPAAQVAAIRLADAQRAYDDLNKRYNSELAKIDTGLNESLKKYELELRQALLTRLRAGDHQVAEENNTLFARKQQELVTNVPIPKLVNIPMISFPAMPASTMTLATDDLSAFFDNVEAIDRQTKQIDVLQIDQCIKELLTDRERLVRDIGQDTRETASAVAKLHGYSLSTTSGNGKDITSDIRGWMAEYWVTQ